MRNILFIIQRGRGVGSQKKYEILIIQVMDSSDLKCIKGKINITKPQN